jgi:hypothetical protein
VSLAVLSMRYLGHADMIKKMEPPSIIKYYVNSFEARLKKLRPSVRLMIDIGGLKNSAENAFVLRETKM